MCSMFVRKEANRFYWIVKGHLIPESWSDEDVEGIYNSYMKRLWGNNERAVYAEEGFESAWNARELETVAILGYNQFLDFKYSTK